MAKFVLKNAWVQVNSVDLSTYVKSVTIESKKNMVEVTAMGDTAVARAVGISDDSIKVRFLQDMAASAVDATLWPLYSGGSSFVVAVVSSGSTPSATNPKYSATCIMETYQPISGDVGSAAEIDVNFLCQGAIARATS